MNNYPIKDGVTYLRVGDNVVIENGVIILGYRDEDVISFKDHITFEIKYTTESKQINGTLIKINKDGTALINTQNQWNVKLTKH